MVREKNPAIGSSWDDLQKTIFTKEEIAASELRVALMLEIIDARKKQGISQKKLEELSGQTTCYRTYGDWENGTPVRYGS